MTRVGWLKAVALVTALASLTINFGLIDLVDGFTGYVDQERNQVLDVGWGAVFGVVLPLGLLSQLRCPERRIAGVQQTSVVALALALAGAAGESWWYLVLAAGVAGVSAVLLVLHPARQTSLARGRQPERTMLALAAVAAGPALVYVWRTASAQRRDLPPADAVSNGLHHWTVMAALALLVLLLVLLAGHPVTIRCDERGDHVGFIQHADGVATVGGTRAYLTPERCYDLYRLAFRHDVVFSRTARALDVLAHESWHLRGVRNEARTECYALQSGVKLGERLGVSAQTAARMMRAQLIENSLLIGGDSEYRVPPECREGGALDLAPRRMTFP